MDCLLRSKENNDISGKPYLAARLKSISITAACFVAIAVMSAGTLCADTVPTINPGDIHPRFDRTPHITLNCSSVEMGNTIPGTSLIEVISDPIPGVFIMPVKYGMIGLMLPPNDGIKLICTDNALGRYADIPLTWQFRYRSNCNWTNWMDSQTGVMPGTSAPALLWQIGDGKGITYEFQLRCIAQIAPMQLAGLYTTNIQLSITGCEVGR